VDAPGSEHRAVQQVLQAGNAVPLRLAHTHTRSGRTQLELVEVSAGTCIRYTAMGLGGVWCLHTLHSSGHGWRLVSAYVTEQWAWVASGVCIRYTGMGLGGVWCLATTENTALGRGTPFRADCRYQRFGEAYRLHLQD
jgi:hypothetical protein